MSKHQVLLIENQLKELLLLKIIEPIDDEEKIYPNYLFCVKQEEKIRLIYDMKKLNSQIKFQTFKCLKLTDILPILQQMSFACKIDLSKAYHHLPINKSFKKFFAFEFKGKKYAWQSMPFGLSSAPYLFSRVIQSVVVFLRMKYQMEIFFYLDDILIMGMNELEVRQNVERTINLLTELGFTINLKKSQLIPS